MMRLNSTKGTSHLVKAFYYSMQDVRNELQSTLGGEASVIVV